MPSGKASSPEGLVTARKPMKAARSRSGRNCDLSIAALADGMRRCVAPQGTPSAWPLDAE